MARRTAIALDREQVVTAALALLAEDGLDALSTRRLAERLSVQAPALYWHFRDKSALLGLMSEKIYARAFAAAVTQPDWRGWLLTFGGALLHEFRSTRDSARLCAGARPVDAGPPAERARAIAMPLVERGLSVDAALVCQANVISFAVGWGVFEENGPMHDYLHAMMDVGRSFELGLAALVAGLDATI